MSSSRPLPASEGSRSCLGPQRPDRRNAAPRCRLGLGSAIPARFAGVAKVSTGDQLFYHDDHLGGLNTVTNQVASRVQLVEYQPWGTISRAEGSADPTVRFTGQDFDAETGLLYYGGRYYDPELGRFISPDPAAPNVWDPQRLNRYAYVRNNPTTRIDPSGFDDVDLGDDSGNSAATNPAALPPLTFPPLDPIVVTAPRFDPPLPSASLGLMNLFGNLDLGAYLQQLLTAVPLSTAVVGDLNPDPLESYLQTSVNDAVPVVVAARPLASYAQSHQPFEPGSPLTAYHKFAYFPGPIFQGRTVEMGPTRDNTIKIFDSMGLIPDSTPAALPATLRALASGQVVWGEPTSINYLQFWQELDRYSREFVGRRYDPLSYNSNYFINWTVGRSGGESHVPSVFAPSCAPPCR